jgi:O-antigen/teichoic acid export membrane protein
MTDGRTGAGAGAGDDGAGRVDAGGDDRPDGPPDVDPEESRTASLSIGREAFVALFAKFVLAVLGFVGIVYFYDQLGPAVIGVYYTVLAGGKIASQVPGGVANAVQKRVSEVTTDSGEYLGLGLVVVGALSGLAAVGAVVARPWLAGYVDSPAHLVGGVAIFASLSLFALTNRFYSGIGHPGASFWTDAVRSAVTLAAQVALVIAGFRELGLMWGFTIATALTGAGVLVLAGVRPRVPSERVVDRTAAFAKWSVPNAFTSNLYQRVDVLILAALVGSTAVGVYEPALRLTVPALFVAGGVGDSLTVKASGLTSLDRDVLHDMKNAVSYTGLLAIPIFFGALAMPTALMRTVYGPTAAAGALALVGLAAFQVFNAYRIPFDKVVNGIDRPELQLLVGGFTLLVNVPLAVALAGPYGLEGVVLATVVAEAVRFAVYQVVALRVFGTVVFTRPIVEQFAAGVVMFGAVELVTARVGITSWLVLVGVVAAGAAVYFGTLVLVSPHFRLTVGNVAADLPVVGAAIGRSS